MRLPCKTRLTCTSCCQSAKQSLHPTASQGEPVDPTSAATSSKESCSISGPAAFVSKSWNSHTLLCKVWPQHLPAWYSSNQQTNLTISTSPYQSFGVMVKFVLHVLLLHTCVTPAAGTASETGSIVSAGAVYTPRWHL